MIALICPTRGRPIQFKKMLESAFRTAADPKNFWVYYYISENDPTYEYYPRLERTSCFRGPDWPTVMCSNYMASHENMDNKDLLMIAADDMVFTTPCWDTALLDHYNALEKKQHVYAFQDSRDADGTPHPIATKEFVAALGYLSCPIFMHWYIDYWMVEIAKANGCFTHMRDYLLVHEKGSDKGQADETHTRIRKNGTHQRDTFAHEKMQHLLDMEKCRMNEAMR